MHIIPFENQYKAQVIDLITAIQQTEFGIKIRLAEQPDLDNIPAVYQKGCGNFWVAVVDDKVVGTISLMDIGEGQGALRKMFVAEKYRGSVHGVAKNLLDELLRWSKKEKLKEVYLGTTSKFLAAHRFYEKNGFVEVSKDDLPQGFQVMAVDTKFYRHLIARMAD